MPDLLDASEEGRLGPGHAVTAEAARALALAAGVPARRCSRAGPGEAVLSPTPGSSRSSRPGAATVLESFLQTTTRILDLQDRKG